MKYTLSLKSKFYSRDGAHYGTGKVSVYDVDGLPEGQKISIENKRSTLQEPLWQIGAYIVGQATKWAGAFTTAEAALAQLQREIDAADKSTPEVLERIAESRGWKRVPVVGSSNETIFFNCGPCVIRVRMSDGAWAFYSDTEGQNRLPDKVGNDFPSLMAFFSSFDSFGLLFQLPNA